jgi:hypothetical protein
MSKDKTVTEEQATEEQKTKESVNKVLEATRQDGDLIENAISIFSKLSEEQDEPMSDEHKDYVRKFAAGLSEQWGNIIVKLEGALMDPETRKIIEKKLQVAPNKNKPEKK